MADMLVEASDALRHDELDDTEGEELEEQVTGEDDGAAEDEDEWGEAVDEVGGDGPPMEEALTEMGTMPTLAESETAAIEKSRRAGWLRKHYRRAKLFFGVVPGHDDPDCDKLEVAQGRRCLPMISPTSNFRVGWDLLVFLFLIYIILVVPLELGFLDERVTTGSTPIGFINRVVDVLFIVDIFLNMRTGYVNVHKELVMDPDAALKEYTWTWFPIDFVSSMPPVLEVIVYLATSSTHKGPVKVVRLARVLKITKLLRLAKLAKLTDGDSAFADSVEDFTASSRSMFAVRCLTMIAASFFLAHMLACFMAVSGPGWLKTYHPERRGGGAHHDGATPQHWYWFRQYIIAFYWAFTTMTSVGYGDVTPESDAERVYAIFAMMIGVASSSGRENTGQLQTAPISVAFRSFPLIFRRAIIARNGLEARMFFFLEDPRRCALKTPAQVLLVHHRDGRVHGHGRGRQVRHLLRAHGPAQ